MTVPSESDAENEESEIDFVSNPFSSGGGGVRFENQVQASFLAMMLVGGSPPILIGESIRKIKLQGKYAGFHTDDLVVFTGSAAAKTDGPRLLAQIKHKVSFTRNDKLFKQVIESAWKDWRNPYCFTRDQDVFALITGPLSARDIAEVRVLLEWARDSESATDFFQKVELANFSSEEKRKKLAVFRDTVAEANAGTAVEGQEFFSFLRHFHLLGYDLDIKAGVMHGLLHSLLAPYAPEQAHLVWSALLDEVQSCNQSSGTISIDSVTTPLRQIFSQRKYSVAPPRLSPERTPALSVREIGFVSELMIANLLGQWHEVSDRAVVETLIRVDYETWTNRLNELLVLPDSPIALRENVWRIRDRRTVWQEMAPRLTPATLRIFEAAISKALHTPDDSSEAASTLEWSKPRHSDSRSLRRGLAESLGLLAAFSSELKHCSPTDAETTAFVVVRDLLANADWRKWSILNDVMPLLAEASPTAFLDAMERTLKEFPDHFPQLFAQEAAGSNEMTGTLWGLETIAWNGEFLMRAAVVLADLAAIDPGGRWANRPFNSLMTILLPWFPQTLAQFTKQVATVRAVLREQPDVGWRLLLAMMPSASGISRGTHRPAYRDWIPEDWEPRITPVEYGRRVIEYARIAAETACQDTLKLKDTLDFLRYVPVESLGEITKSLIAANETVANEDAFELWTALSEFLEQHRHADLEYSGLTKQIVQFLEIAKERLAPTTPMQLHRWLFNGDPHEHMDPDGDWQKQLSDISAKQDSAIFEILKQGGTRAIRLFAERVASPSSVGFALGRSGPRDIDTKILPLWLNGEDKSLRDLVWAFIQGRFAVHQYDWVDSVCSLKWSKGEILHFLQCLPFGCETWNRVQQLLDAESGEYWRTVRVDPYNLGDKYIVAVEELLKFDRPAAALSCFRIAVQAKKEVPIDCLCQALLLVTPQESGGEPNARTTAELIKYLQRHPETPRKVLCDIEWKYLQILDDHHRASAVTLQSELAVKPELFCQIIRLCFRSRNAVELLPEATDEEKAIAGNAYYLLSRWRQLPGTEPDGSLSSAKLKDWLDRVLNECDASGHGEVARLRIGELFIHAPSDPSGLWMHHTVAEALNARDAESMRDGYRSGWFNSRGIHRVDPQGRPEKALADRYKSHAEEVENAGYQRLAQTLRDLADMYHREAHRIIERYQPDETS